MQVRILREEATRHGLAPAEVAEALETAFKGRAVSQILEGRRAFDLVAWFDERARRDVEAIRSTPIGFPSGAEVTPGRVAEVVQAVGPNTINREDVARRIVVQENTAGRNLVVVVKVARSVVPTLTPATSSNTAGNSRPGARPTAGSCSWKASRCSGSPCCSRRTSGPGGRPSR